MLLNSETPETSENGKIHCVDVNWPEMPQDRVQQWYPVKLNVNGFRLNCDCFITDARHGRSFAHCSLRIVLRSNTRP